jgi:hypothetical protein
MTTAAASDIDASALTGKLVFTGADAQHSLVGSATATNTITLGNTTTNAAYTGGAGADTITATALTTGDLTANLGGGNDKVTVTTGFVAGGKLVMDGGTGTDTLATAAATDFSAVTLSLTGVENLNVTTGSTFAGYQLNGTSFAVAVQATNGNLIVTSDSTKDKNGTVDLSGLTLSTATGTNVSTTTLTGLDGSKDTYVGTAVSDTFDMGTGADTVTTGAGSDIVTIVAGDSLEAGMDKITDFTIAKDKVDLASTDVTADVAIGAAIDVKAAIAGGTGSESVSAIVTNGVVTLTGTDASKIDTLAEWIDVLETGTVVVDDDNAIFSLGGNTYLFQDNTAAIAATTTTGHDIIELTGLTGITALGTAVAANTLVIS